MKRENRDPQDQRPNCSMCGRIMRFRCVKHIYQCPNPKCGSILEVSPHHFPDYNPGVWNRGDGAYNPADYGEISSDLKNYNKKWWKRNPNYMAKWHKRHPNYYKESKARRNKLQKEFRARHKKKIAVSQRRWYAQNKDTVVKAWRDRNKEKIKGYSKKTRQKQKEAKEMLRRPKQYVSVSLRLEMECAETLYDGAKRSNISKSAYIRNLILDAEHRYLQGLEPKPKHPKMSREETLALVKRLKGDKTPEQEAEEFKKGMAELDANKAARDAAEASDQSTTPPGREINKATRPLFDPEPPNTSNNDSETY